MDDVTVTLVGNTGAEVVLSETSNGWMARVPVAVTGRVWDADQAAMKDGPTTWYRVVAFGRLAHNMGLSLHRGERVMVRGRLRVSTWTNPEGVERTTVEVVADAIGHDLRFGMSRFMRVARTEAQTPPGEPEAPDDEAGQDDAA